MTEFSNERILVTGAGGVLGQALLELFRIEGVRDIVAPQRSDCDLTEYRECERLICDCRPSLVVHLASLVFGLGGNLRNQANSLEGNTALNNSFFSALRLAPPKHVFFAGTVASYPYPYRRLPLVEDDFFGDLPHCGEFGYAMAKRHAYAYLALLQSELGVPFTYGILTNLYGRGDRFDPLNGHVIPSLIAKAKSAAVDGQPLEVWGDGTAERDFLHASDAARAIAICMKGRYAGLINISSGETVTIAQIAQIVANAAKLPRVKFNPAAPVGIPRRLVNNCKLRELGFSPRVPIESGLIDTYQWYVAQNGDVRR